MKVGVIFPQTEIGPDPGGVREYAQAAESLGFNHLIVYDHVLGADTTYHTGWQGAYQLKDQFHEPFVVFGYMAGITERIELTTAVLILPQRQTALVAKQAAEVDVLSGGRLRLGIGTGWNHVEYEALGENFHNRGKRSEEQIELLRELWTKKSINFKGKWHTVTHAGINPLPVQRPIPIWLGGSAEPVLERIGRIGDGWFIQSRAFKLDDSGRATIERLHQYARDAGRDPADIGIEGRVDAASGSPEDWVEQAAQWEDFGMTHLGFNTMGAGYRTPDEHINAIRMFKEALPD
ncbi:LLM class F420-dependent oxidoreductase [SAR202 cluster bacterium AD-804-J14_MRT_500m]|nr:LLM class F420-dependent oxidoreductase [SAR202 cluster bacterium AD-804-J14_MRT_500m]